MLKTRGFTNIKKSTIFKTHPVRPRQVDITMRAAKENDVQTAEVWWPHKKASRVKFSLKTNMFS